MGTKVSKNIFHNLSLDIDRYNQKSDTALYILNFAFLNSDNTNTSRTNIKGTDIASRLKGLTVNTANNQGFVSLGSRDYNGIAYIISYNETSKEFAVGSFPSPEYTITSPDGDNPMVLSKTGKLLDVYNHLMNYAGDDNIKLDSAGPFVTKSIQADLNHPFEVEIQPDYDGTVNIIITDKKRPIRIINSGFSAVVGEDSDIALEQSRYEIIDRIGKFDTNKYHKDNIDQATTLAINGSTIPIIENCKVEEGGDLGTGNYVFYFTYEDADGNETDIFGESLLVSVFPGSTPAQASGDLESSKKVSFTIRNLYKYLPVVRAYFSFSRDGATTVYKIIKKYYPVNGTLNFSFTNPDASTDVVEPNAITLKGASNPFRVFESITQIEGRLWLAGPKDDPIEVDTFKDFANKIVLNTKFDTIDSISTDSSENIDGFFSTTNQSTGNNMYYNPSNIYNKLGYMGNETYPFGIVFILPGNKLSPVFPVFGRDNSEGVPYTFSQSDLDYLNDHQGFDIYGSKNNLGLYRFQKRNSSDSPDFLTSDGKVSIMGIEFTIPEIPDDIKKLSIGCMFVRGERNPDLIVQGNAIPTVRLTTLYSAKINDTVIDINTGYLHNDTDDAYRDNSYPLPKYTIQADAFVYEQSDLADKTMSKNFGGGRDIVVDIELNNRLLPGYNETATANNDKTMFGFYSSDIIGNTDLKEILSDETKQISSHWVGSASGVRALTQSEQVPLEFFGPDGGVIVNSTCLIKTVEINKRGEDVQSLDVNCNSSYIYDGTLGNPLKFGAVNSERTFISMRADGANDGIMALRVGRVLWSDYIGLRKSNYSSMDNFLFAGLNNTLGKYSINLVNDGAAAFSGAYKNIEDGHEYSLVTPLDTFNSSVLVNLYSSGGPRTTIELKGYYDTNTIQYFPISDRMYWDLDSAKDADVSNSDTLEGKLVDRKITFYRGDCYINAMIQRVYRAAGDSSQLQGMGMTLYNESSFNLAGRIVDISTYNFLPHVTSTSDGVKAQIKTNKNPDSLEIDLGLSRIGNDKQYVAVPFGAPFIQTVYDTRVMFSDVHIPGTFINGYRILKEDAYQDYSRHVGKITRIININNKLICIQEHGIGSLVVNERIQAADGEAGQIFIENTTVLSSAIQALTETYGTQHGFSVIVTPNAVYGVDVEKSKLWKLSSEGVKLISDLVVNSFLKKNLDKYRKSGIHIFNKNIVTQYDRKNGRVHFVFYNNLGLTGRSQYENNSTFNLAFNEYADKFESFFSFIPYNSFNIFNDFYSFNVKEAHYLIHKHEVNPIRNSFYFQLYRSILRFVVNPNTGDTSQVFDNLGIISNNVLPELVSYFVQGGFTDQTIVYNPNAIHLSNAKYKEEKVFITIPPIKNITNLDTSEELVSNQDNATSIIALNGRFRGKVIEVELIYNSQKLVRINTVHTYYRNTLS